MTDPATVQRISALRPSDLADDVLAAVQALGGEAQRVDIIDRAVDIGGWSPEERAVISWYTGAARKYHLRTLADYAVTLCKERGDLTEGAARGRWRLAPPAMIAPHPHGRVFTAGVGLGDAPVDDSWAAADQEHLWFSRRSLQLSRGDHLFALGAGRGSVVLGLFEVASGGTARTPVNRWDPDRWPWAIAVRPLASVPPPLAVSVPGLTAPRQTAQHIGDRRLRAALYAAVQAHPLPAAAGAATAASGAEHSERESRASARRGRRFDPGRPPTPAQPGAGVMDDEETLALREKARQGHHQLLVAVHAALQAAGWAALEEIPAAIDLRGLDPAGRSVIFEAKTISADNETAQCRSALAQLLEYRLEYGHPDDLLAVAVDAPIGHRRAQILDRLGIAVVLAGAQELAALNETGGAVLAGTPAGAAG